MLPASAVAVGAMAPDLPLFLPFLPGYALTHDLRYLPVTLVLAGVLWAVWRYIVAPAAADLSPAWLAKHYVPKPMSTLSPARAGFGTVAALAMGILTHVLWDSFTHVDRWGSNHLSVLRETIGTQPIYSVLQELSSVLGLVAVVIWLLARTRLTLDAHRRLRMRRLRIAMSFGAGLALAVGILIGLIVGGPLWRVLYTIATLGGVLVAIAVAVGVGRWWLSAGRYAPADCH